MFAARRMLRVDSRPTLAPSRRATPARQTGAVGVGIAPLRAVRGPAPTVGARPRVRGDAVRAAPAKARHCLRVPALLPTRGARGPDPGPCGAASSRKWGTSSWVAIPHGSCSEWRGTWRGSRFDVLPPLPLPERWEAVSPVASEADDERERACLDRCLEDLAAPDRDLILGYHQGERSARIRRRSELARELGLSPNALRLKIHRITGSLRECLVRCTDHEGGPGPTGWHEESTGRRGDEAMRLTPDFERTLRRYVLGDLEEDVRPELEELLVTDSDAFEALGVIEDELIERVPRGDRLGYRETKVRAEFPDLP